MQLGEVKELLKRFLFRTFYLYRIHFRKLEKRRTGIPVAEQSPHPTNSNGPFLKPESPNPLNWNPNTMLKHRPSVQPRDDGLTATTDQIRKEQAISPCSWTPVA